MKAKGWKRKELWVPAGMTKEESAVLQDRIEEILIDIRRAPPAETVD